MSSSQSPLPPFHQSPEPRRAPSTDSLTPPPSLSPPREGFTSPLNQQVHSSLPATPYNAISVTPNQLRSGTFGGTLKPSDEQSAKAYMLSCLKKSAEPHMMRPLISSISALVGEPVDGPEADEPRLECEAEISIKDIYVNGGVAFKKTRFQQAMSSVYRSQGRRMSPSAGVYHTDIALLASSCDYASKLKSSNSARTRPSAVSAKRRRLQQSDPELSPNGPYFCAISLIVEIKTLDPWAQYCQTLAYVLQAHERCGCRLGIAFHKKSFSRIFAVNAHTCLVEMNDRSLVGTVVSMVELASSRLYARGLYQHNLKNTSSEGKTMVNPEAFETFAHIVKSAAAVFYHAELTRVPLADELSRRTRSILDDENVSSLRSLKFDSRRTTADADYLTLVRILRPMSAIPEVKEGDTGDGSDDDQGEFGDAAGSRHRKTTLPSSANLGANNTSAESRGIAGAREEEEEHIDEDMQIEDDTSPVSLTEVFQRLQAAGVKLVLVSAEIMTAAIDLYRDGQGNKNEAESSRIKSGSNIDHVGQSLSQSS